jgi:hypothetical protein
MSEELYRTLRDLNVLRQKAGLPCKSYIGLGVASLRALLADALKGRFEEMVVAEVDGPIHNPKPMNPASVVYPEHNPNVLVTGGWRKRQ